MEQRLISKFVEIVNRESPGLVTEEVVGLLRKGNFDEAIRNSSYLEEMLEDFFMEVAETVPGVCSERLKYIEENLDNFFANRVKYIFLSIVDLGNDGKDMEPIGILLGDYFAENDDILEYYILAFIIFDFGEFDLLNDYLEKFKDIELKQVTSDLYLKFLLKRLCAKVEITLEKNFHELIDNDEKLDLYDSILDAVISADPATPNVYFLKSRIADLKGDKVASAKNFYNEIGYNPFLPYIVEFLSVLSEFEDNLLLVNDGDEEKCRDELFFDALRDVVTHEGVFEYFTRSESAEYLLDLLDQVFENFEKNRDFIERIVLCLENSLSLEGSDYEFVVFIRERLNRAMRNSKLQIGLGSN